MNESCLNPTRVFETCHRSCPIVPIVRIVAKVSRTEFVEPRIRPAGDTHSGTYMCYIWSMPQLHLYATESLSRRIREKAKASGLSVSRYLAQLVQKEISEQWPPGFFDEVVGGWKGDRLEREGQPHLELRDEL